MKENHNRYIIFRLWASVASITGAIKNAGNKKPRSLCRAGILCVMLRVLWSSDICISQLCLTGMRAGRRLQEKEAEGRRQVRPGRTGQTFDGMFGSVFAVD